ncbi:MAG TPA: molybdopterin-synthase adenylyltransferase MoeB [Dermatophilaceae bacterium]|nr:molybdopterin-synthase adenylyltransferase MoeB [Dermatophilaceae bacterium]
MALPPLVAPGGDLTREEVQRYARHLLIPEVGEVGQRRLKNARVLVVGAGGLGSPALLYLAAAGVGTIGVVDADVVEESNLQRQVIHGVDDIGRPKTASAAAAVARVNPLVEVVQHELRLDSGNALDVLTGYDLVVDGADNFPTRYLVNDACVIAGKPHVWGSILRFDGQVSVWWARHGPCYRCVFPAPPPPGLVPSCAEAGVLGVLCAAVGAVQGAEAVKLLLGIGEPLVGRLLVHDALRQTWDSLTVGSDPSCSVCAAPDPRLVDYEDFCGMPGSSAPSVRTVDAGELRDLLAERARGGANFVLVDVRGEQERAIVSIPGAEAVPMEAFREGRAAELLAGVPVILHCKAGSRSAEAGGLLLAAGHPDVRHLEGGVLAWAREVDPSLPVY